MLGEQLASLLKHLLKRYFNEIMDCLQRTVFKSSLLQLMLKASLAIKNADTCSN